MKIGIIDTGINVTDRMIKKSLCIYEEGNSICVDDNIYDELGHGTRIFEIIKKYCDSRTEFVMIKLRDLNNDNINEEVLLEAINILIREKCKLINMSFSVMGSSKIIREINEVAAEHNVIIFQSNPNLDGMHFKNESVGIAVSGRIMKERDCYWYDEVNNRLIVDFTPEVIKYNKEYLLFGKNNSMACAKITGITTNFAEKELKDMIISNRSKSDWTIEELYEVEIDLESTEYNFDKSDRIYSYIYNLFSDYYVGEQRVDDISKEILYGIKFCYGEKNFFDIVKSIFVKYDILHSLRKYNRRDLSNIEKIYGIILKVKI